MFILFCNLYYSILTGSWHNYSLTDWNNNFKTIGNAIGKLVTSIFGNVTYETFGNDFMLDYSDNYFALLALILATITSIGIVVVATKGIKKIFTVFFYGVR